MTEDELIKKLNANPREQLEFPAEWDIDFEKIAKTTGRTIERVSTFSGYNEPGQDAAPANVCFRPKEEN